MLRRAIPVFMMVFFAAGLAEAQDIASIQQGMRIRVTPVLGKTHTGGFLRASGDTLLYFLPGAPGVAHSLSIQSLRRLQVSTGRSRSKGALIYGLLGTALGTGGGAVVGAVTHKDDTCLLCDSRSFTAFAYGVLGGAAGLVGGTAYGIARGREKWRTLSLPRR